MKKIPLSQGKFALVDDEDFDYLNQWKWHAWRNKRAFYALSNIVSGRVRTAIKMHRLLAQVSDPLLQVDHIDGNGLNNQKSNLRVCLNIQNAMNRGKRKVKTTSKYKGVNLKIRRSGTIVWVAQIQVDGRKMHIGCFETQESAALAYNEAAKEHFKEFAFLNKVQ